VEDNYKCTEIGTIFIDTEDVGFTQKVTIRVNEVPIISYMPRTRHEHRAIQSGRTIIASALTNLIREAVENAPYAEEVELDYHPDAEVDTNLE